MKLQEKLPLLLQRLLELYPAAHCELDYKNPLELLVATILSAQCTDVRVNMVTPALFKRCQNAHDFATISQEELEKLIHSTGFYRSKAISIIGAAKIIEEQYRGEVPQKLEQLRQLPGIGRKTANVVLSNGFDLHEGIAVDTHVGRLAQRLGFTRETTPEKIEQKLMKLFDRSLWGKISHLLVWHGRYCCSSRNPKCSQCGLYELCPSADNPNRYFRATEKIAKPTPRKRKTEQKKLHKTMRKKNKKGDSLY